MEEIEIIKLLVHIEHRIKLLVNITKSIELRSGQLRKEFPYQFLCILSFAQIFPLRRNVIFQFGPFNQITLVLVQCLEFYNDVEFDLARCAKLRNRHPMHVRFGWRRFIHFVQQIINKLRKQRPLWISKSPLLER